MGKKTRPIHMFPQNPLQIKRYTQSESIGMDRVILCKEKEKKKLGCITIQQNTLLTKAILNDRESHYILIEETLQQEDLTLINNYTPNRGAPKHVEQISMDIKGEDDRKIVPVRASNTPLTSVDRSSRQKTNKDTMA